MQLSDEDSRGRQVLRLRKRAAILLTIVAFANSAGLALPSGPVSALAIGLVVGAWAVSGAMWILYWNAMRRRGSL